MRVIVVVICVQTFAVNVSNQTRTLVDPENLVPILCVASDHMSLAASIIAGRKVEAKATTVWASPGLE
jgi:hypothetical protein